MSSTAELHQVVYNALKNTPALMAIASAVYDRVPENRQFPYVSIGPASGVEDDAECISGREVTMQIDAWSRAVGTEECQTMTDLVRRALHRQPLQMAENALCDIWVVSDEVRPDPDGLTTHGIVRARAMIEES